MDHNGFTVPPLLLNEVLRNKKPTDQEKYDRKRIKLRNIQTSRFTSRASFIMKGTSHMKLKGSTETKEATFSPSNASMIKIRE